jgi:hypothetical protein
MSNIESRTEPETHDRFRMKPLLIRLLLKITSLSRWFIFISSSSEAISGGLGISLHSTLTHRKRACGKLGSLL